jgi:DNA-binding winged helix-turn-helix (wHTH) protein/tetratricopeptide (TPR) repeat protein
MLKLVDLANRPDFDVGPLRISPARRLIEGPAGSATVEPIVMKVFLLLLDARGSVVTRDELFGAAWGGVFVGDDSLNRAIGHVRKIAAETAPGLFEVETIPRTGYRLAGGILASEDAMRGQGAERPPFGISRRAMLGSAAAVGVAAAGGVGLWTVRRSREGNRFNQLMDVGKQAQLYDDDTGKAAEYFQQAVAMRPDNAEAQGFLALTQATLAEHGGPNEVSAAVQGAERAARAALAVDPDEPNARLALITLQRSTLDLATNEDRLREILATAPNNIAVMGSLWALLQSAGRSRDALALVERANALEPLAASCQYPKAQLLWIVGRNAEADRVIDRAMQFWPNHAGVRFARFTIYAYTGRPRAALAMLDDKTRPIYPPDAVSLWRVSLAALEQRSAASIAAARSANVEAAKQNPALSNQAVLVLSALGELDAAFDIANRLLLFRPVEPRPQTGSATPPVKSTSWRFAPWLFIPPAEPMQADPRFNALCDGIGLTEYWAKRGIKPDYQLGIT